MTPRIFWIASYPKAGNTWLRFILADLLAGPVTSAAQVERLIPDMHRGMQPHITPLHRGAAFLKTHRLPAHLGMAKGRDAGALYIVRNPLDLLCSVADYRCVKPADRSAWLDAVVANRGAPEFAAKGMGTLPESVAAWMAAPVPVLPVRYEDLSSDPVRAVGEIAGRLGIPVSIQGIAATMKRCSFDAMRRMEQEESGALGPFSEADKPPGWRFMNRGRVGSYLEILTGAQIDAINGAFGGVMRSLGYRLGRSRELIVEPMPKR